MAFANKDGLKVSFFCDELITELKEDIDEFGGYMLVDVIVQQSHGVTLYKDYFPCVPGEPLERDKIDLTEGESWIQMSATALLMMYEKQNSAI